MTTSVETPRTSAPVTGPPAGAVEPGLDRPVRLIGRRLWLSVGALLLAVGGATAWGAAGSLPHTATLHGVLAHGGAPVVARAAAPGSVLRVLTAPGARVTKGQTLAVLATTGSGPADPLELTAPQDGTVTAVLAGPGRQVVPGTGVVALDAADEPATVRLFVTSADRMRQLRIGQPVTVDLPTGPVRLRITSADPYPAPATTLAGTLPVPVPGVPTGDTPVWTVYAAPAAGPGADTAARQLSAAAALPAALNASVDLGARHPYQVLLNATGAGR
ncbi:HlyD family efflux transporter periplasmic adaptor subunit [Streptomyces sp. NPDC051976]|uniref:acetyl-CoA carboxylase biotin carboxyl carrier protein subunit n=1 Tax=Streptomyces sp. NPDC051976 TaxID=3154947 RepID=UPI00343B8EC2